MTTYLFANNASSTLAGPISSTATSVSVASGTGVLFPNPSAGQAFKLTFVSASNPNLREIVLVTGVSGDTFTIVRGQESTTAESWNAGDFANHWLTAGSFANFIQGNYGPTAFDYYGVDTGTANAIAATVAPTVTALAAGMVFYIKLANSLTGAATANISGLGIVNVKRADGAATQKGDGVAGEILELVYDGTNLQIAGLLSAFVPSHSSQIITTTQNFTAPQSGYYTVEGWGGGGGGGGAAGTTCAAAGGGGGGYFKGVYYLTAGTVVLCTIGAGGSAGTSGGGNGGSGGTTSFGALASANGGTGGGGSTSGINFSNGTGGTATGGTIFNMTGSGIGVGYQVGGSLFTGGVGSGPGPSFTPSPISVANYGYAGQFAGQGGQGASSNNTGGSGAVGQINITW